MLHFDLVIEAIVGRNTLIMNTTMAPKVQAYNPARVHGGFKGRNKVCLIISARNSNADQ